MTRGEANAKNAMKLVVVRYFDGPAHAELAKCFLQAAGIQSAVFAPVAFNSSAILVAEHDWERADALLQIDSS